MAVWWPLVATIKRTCCRSTETLSHTQKHSSLHIKTLRYSHHETFKVITRQVNTSSLKQAEPWSFILLFLITIFLGGNATRKWRHSLINQSINCYEICICLNMEFDSIKPISRTISLCKHLGERGGDREWQSVECGWGSFRGGNIPLRTARCVYIMRFNWRVLHQCQEVSWWVCRGLCSFWLSLVVLISPQQANTWLETKPFSGFNHRQSAREKPREVVGTSRQTGNIRTPPGLVLKVPKPHNNNSSNGSAGYFWTQTIHDSSKGYLEDVLCSV